ncbi:unnamed protein product [Withania somnifera]
MLFSVGLCVLRASWTQRAFNGCGDFLIADSEIFRYMDCCTSVAASPICSYVWLLVDIFIMMLSDNVDPNQII